MNLLSLGPRVPDIMARWTPDIEAALRRHGVRQRDTTCIIGKLQDLAEQVSSSPPTTDFGRALLRCYNELRTVQPALSPSDFLLAEYHVKRGEPARALGWNEEAQKNLNGTRSPIAEAALLSQQLTIRVQQNDLEEAEKLRRAIVTPGLQEDELTLFDAPLRNFDITLQYESGTWDEQRVRDLMRPLPQFYQEFLLGRFHLQYRRENKALAEFDHALELFERERDTGYPAFRHIIDLHRARALYQQNHLKEAHQLFEGLLSRFIELGLVSAQLRVKIGLANIERINHNYVQSEEDLLEVLRKAEDLGLKKTAFHACIGLAALKRECDRLQEARTFLEEAQNYLNPQNKKHLCTLDMQWAELEYDSQNTAAGDRYFQESENLLSTTNQEEALLLRATMAFHKALYKMRVGELDAARETVRTCINELKSRILGNPLSEYREEASPSYLANRLLRLDAYLALRKDHPISALYSCQEAREASRPDDLRSLSKIVFWESIAYAMLGELEQSVTKLEEVDALSQSLDVQHSAGLYLREAAALDDSGYISQLAFSVGYLFRGSLFEDRFRKFESEFASAFEPRFSLRGKLDGRLAPGQGDQIQALEKFVPEYLRCLQVEGSDATPGSETLSRFAMPYLQALELEDEGAFGLRFSTDLEERGRKVWSNLVRALHDDT
jgi:hypothetical protein